MGVEQSPDIVRQGESCERLYEERFATSNLDTVVLNRSRCERRHEQHLNPGPQTTEFCARPVLLCVGFGTEGVGTSGGERYRQEVR